MTNQPPLDPIFFTLFWMLGCAVVAMLYSIERLLYKIKELLQAILQDINEE